MDRFPSENLSSADLDELGSTKSLDFSSTIQDIVPTPGVLEGRKCSLQDYFTILGNFGRYYLWDGILHFVDMPNNARHQNIEVYLKHLFDTKRAKANETDGIRHFSSRIMCTIGDESPRRALEADLVVSANFSSDEHKPSCKNPVLVAEVTSNNRRNDTVKKIQRYSEFGIPEYIIVDCKNSCIHWYTKSGTTYKLEKKFESGVQFQHPLFESSAVCAILNPPSKDNSLVDELLQKLRQAKNLTRRIYETAREKAAEFGFTPPFSPSPIESIGNSPAKCLKRERTSPTPSPPTCKKEKLGYESDEEVNARNYNVEDQI